MLLHLAGNGGGGASPSASRLQLKVAPGESIKLDSAEGEALEIKCGDGAAMLEVKGGSTPASYVSR